MRVCSWLSLAALVLALGLPAIPALAQGTATQTLNFEPPVHKPIQVVRVGTRDFLLVANVSDDSVEVYDTAGPNFLFRVPTGQAPVTIAVRPTPIAGGGRQIYTANWLGDSVTVFEIFPGTGGALAFRLVTTEPVGDEPVGLVFLPENPAEPATLPGGPFHELLLVTFSSKSVWGVFTPGNVVAVLPAIELLDPTGGFGVKDPRTIAFSPVTPGTPNQMWILNHRGGNSDAPVVYDFDLWGTNNTTTSAGSGRGTQPVLGGLGTTNFQMTFLPSGDLWVVGQRARNKDPQLGNLVLAIGEPIHQNQVLAETGFVTSYVARVRNVNTAPAIDFLDLNDASQGAAAPPIQATVPVTQPTDVVAYADGSRVFVTGYNSDTVATIRPGPGAPSTWSVARLSVAPPGPISVLNPTGAMRGPRGLALRAAGTTPAAGDRLYVYNRVDNSVTVINPVGVPAVLANFALRGQVEPAYVVTGRKFLYSSALSGTGVAGVGGNVSCASCHIDGNTDFLAWNLSDGGAIPVPGTPNALPGGLGPNPGQKGQLVTQPLRGLVNFEVIGPAVQDLFFSNQPYHWRGDKGTFEQFNAAYVNLMGAPNLNGGAATPAFNEGIPVAQMTEYRNFTFSMHYPPNPDQPYNRVYSGTLGNANDHVSGSGAQLGLKAFHITGSDPIACVHCHTLPEGSNNRFTENIGNFFEPAFPGQGLETAQLKALVLKEKRLQRVVGGAFQPVPAGGAAVTGEFGLTHTGLSDGIPGFGSLTINDFVNGFALGTLSLPTTNAALPDAVSLYMREFDSGVAPLVGFTGTTDVARFNANPVGATNSLTDLENQVRLANTGLAVHVVASGVLRGFWYDASDPGSPYHEEPQIGIPPVNLTQTQLLDFVRNGSGTVAPGNFMTFHFTPLGSQRRIARVQGGLAPALAGGVPTGVLLATAVPNTANVSVPQFTLDWANLIPPFTLITGSALPFFDIRPQASAVHYQLSLRNWVPGGGGVPAGFGLAALRHEVPRRLRVSGKGIQEGAFLLIFPPSPTDIAAATTTTPPPTVPNAGTNPFVMTLPIYPAEDTSTVPTSIVWQTADEIDPVIMLALLNGGPGNVPVVNVFFDPLNLGLFVLTPPFDYQVNVSNLFNPLQANWYFVQVVNNTSTGFQFSAGSWQRLTIQ